MVYYNMIHQLNHIIKKAVAQVMLNHELHIN